MVMNRHGEKTKYSLSKSALQHDPESGVAMGGPIVGYVGKKLCGYSNYSFAECFHRDPVATS
jgi:hypothetical protein